MLSSNEEVLSKLKDIRDSAVVVKDTIKETLEQIFISTNIPGATKDIKLKHTRFLVATKRITSYLSELIDFIESVLNSNEIESINIIKKTLIEKTYFKCKIDEVIDWFDNYPTFCSKPELSHDQDFVNLHGLFINLQSNLLEYIEDITEFFSVPLDGRLKIIIRSNDNLNSFEDVAITLTPEHYKEAITPHELLESLVGLNYTRKDFTIVSHDKDAVIVETAPNNVFKLSTDIHLTLDDIFERSYYELYLVNRDNKDTYLASSKIVVEDYPFSFSEFKNRLFTTLKDFAGLNVEKVDIADGSPFDKSTPFTILAYLNEKEDTNLNYLKILEKVLEKLQGKIVTIEEPVLPKEEKTITLDLDEVYDVERTNVHYMLQHELLLDLVQFKSTLLRELSKKNKAEGEYILMLMSDVEYMSNLIIYFSLQFRVEDNLNSYFKPSHLLLYNKWENHASYFMIEYTREIYHFDSHVNQIIDSIKTQILKIFAARKKNRW